MLQLEHVEVEDSNQDINQKSKEKMAPPTILITPCPNDKTTTKTCQALVKVEAKTLKLRQIKERQKKSNQKTKEKKAIPLPAPPLSNNKTKEDKKDMHEKQIIQDNNNNNASAPPAEEEGISLHVLSARSSTPYTQAMSCTAVSCDLEHVSQHVSPVKEHDPKTQQTQEHDKKHNLNVSKSVPAMGVTTSISDLKAKLGQSKSYHNAISRNGTFINYTRANLLLIRNELLNASNERNLLPAYAVQPKIIKCDVIELEARLRRLNIWKILDDGPSALFGRNRDNSRASRNNDMMPAFYRRKNATQLGTDESIISCHPPQQHEIKVSCIFY